MKFYHPQNKQNVTFLPKGAFMEVNQTISNMIKAQNELNDSITTIPVIKLKEESLDIPITKTNDEGKEYTFTARQFLNNDKMFLSIEPTKNTTETGLHHFVCKKKNITRAWDRIDSFITLYQDPTSALFDHEKYWFESEIPARSKTDQKRQPFYQKVQTHMSYRNALTQNVPTNNTGAKRMTRQRGPPLVTYEKSNEQPSLSDITNSNKQSSKQNLTTKMNELETKLNEICDFLKKLNPENNKIYTSPTKATPKSTTKPNQYTKTMEEFINTDPDIKTKFDEFMSQQPKKQLQFKTPDRTATDPAPMDISIFLQDDFDPGTLNIDMDIDVENAKRKADALQNFLLNNAKRLNQASERLDLYYRERREKSPASQRKSNSQIS